MATREPIYAALWDLVSLDPRVQAVFATASRYTKHFEDVPAEQMPALFLLQKRETWERPGRGIPAKRWLHCHFLVYTNTAEPEGNLPSTAINTLMDVLDGVLNPPNGQVVTLGERVNHVYLEGEVDMAEGLLQPKSIVVVPIAMLIP